MSTSTHRMKFITLNARGLRYKQKRRSLFEWIRNKKVEIIALQETYCAEDFIDAFNSDWDGRVWHSPATSSHLSETFILIPKEFNIEIINAYNDKAVRIIILNVKYLEEKLTIANIYAPSDKSQRIQFLKELPSCIVKSCLSLDNVFVLGDFNSVTDKSDRLTGNIGNSTKELTKFTKTLKVKGTWAIKHKNIT